MNGYVLFCRADSTEGLFSVPLAMGDKKSAIVPHSMFYEFLPVDAQDDFSQIVTLDKVEVGRDYEIIHDPMPMVCTAIVCGTASGSWINTTNSR